MRYPKEVTIAKKSLSERKAEEIAVVDVRTQTPFCDYLVIGSATNQRMLNALAEYLVSDFAKDGLDVKVEGLPESEWMIVDAGNVVVHLFSEAKRKEIDLEGLLSHRAERK